MDLPPAISTKLRGQSPRDTCLPACGLVPLSQSQPPPPGLSAPARACLGPALAQAPLCWPSFLPVARAALADATILLLQGRQTEAGDLRVVYNCIKKCPQVPAILTAMCSVFCQEVAQAGLALMRKLITVVREKGTRRLPISSRPFNQRRGRGRGASPH